MNNDKLKARELRANGLKAIVELSSAESWTLLSTAVVGRLAVIVDDRPDIFPVNHRVDLGGVVFRSGPGTKLVAAVGHRVAFEVDGYDSETASAWSVVVKGQATSVDRVDDALATSVDRPDDAPATSVDRPDDAPATGVDRPDDALAAIALPRVAWHSAPIPQFIRIEPDSITGRRFTVVGGARTQS